MEDLTAKWTELAVGSGHPSLPDTVNRMILVEHNIDGTHDRSTLNIEVISDTEPNPQYPYQKWIDTSVNPGIEKIRNRENTAWLVGTTLASPLPRASLADSATMAVDSAKVGGQVPAWYTPPGAVMAFARLTAPAGWLACDGSEVSRTIYADLFAVADVTFGSGNGTTTFNLPNLQDQFIRGATPGTRSVGSSQLDQVVDHRHFVANIDSNINANSLTADNQLVRSPAPSDINADYVLFGSATEASIGRTSTPVSGSGSETRPKNIALLYCIKY